MDWVTIVVTLVFAFIILNVALVTVAFLVYFERKTLAFAQNRLGPNRAGPRGMFQSFADLIKGLRKEETIPGGADRPVFWIAPLVSAFAALGALAVLPFGQGPNTPGYLDLFGWRQIGWYVSDIGVGALVVLAMSSLGVYGIISAGWSSNSKYSLLGGLRASSQVISYEITLGISLVGVFLLSGTLSLNGITIAQTPYHSALQPGLWFLLLQPVAFIVFLTSAIAETNRTPFDLPEAESELVGGYHTEFSGIRFFLFFLAEYIGMFTVSVVTSVCFLGGWGSPFAAFFDPGGPFSGIPFVSGFLGSGPWWTLLKIAGFLMFYYWLRWTLPRFRYDQLMGLCWKVFLPIILANIIVISLLKLIFFEPGLNLAGSNAQVFWWVVAVIEIIFAVLTVVGLSNLANLGWFGRAERPLLVNEPRQIILVRTTHGGAGTIPGEARTVEVTRSTGGGS